ncbi:MAG: hypothetical protein KatS3mg101_0859 [Patescibacteria group bacterium]|nr:MAG: hypothetical protein KatS3mg101_0859 [Patescibacteria group bacterium]
MRRKKVAIVDLDETLVSVPDDNKEKEKLIKDPELRDRLFSFRLLDQDGNITTMMGVFRNHLDEFIDFLFDNFDEVKVWSAGRRDYVRLLSCIIFKDKYCKLAEIRTRDDCVLDKKKGFLKVLTKDDLKDDIIMIDDNSLVKDLNKDKVIKIEPFIYNNKNDNHLKKIVEKLSKKL